MPLSYSPSAVPLRPLPAALLTFVPPNGEPRVIAVGWVGVVSTVPPLLCLQFGGGADSIELPGVGEPFVVALAAEESPPGLRRNLPPAPAGAAWPVRIECRCRFLEGRFGQYRLGGEIVAVAHDGGRQELVAPVDFSRFAPLAPHRSGGRGG